MKRLIQIGSFWIDWNSVIAIQKYGEENVTVWTQIREFSFKGVNAKKVLELAEMSAAEHPSDQD